LPIATSLEAALQPVASDIPSWAKLVKIATRKADKMTGEFPHIPLHMLAAVVLYTIEEIPKVRCSSLSSSQPSLATNPQEIFNRIQWLKIRCAFFDRNLHSRSAIEFRAFAPLDASRRVINGIPLGWPLSYRFTL
jgi:hypothetical protein